LQGDVFQLNNGEGDLHEVSEGEIGVRVSSLEMAHSSRFVRSYEDRFCLAWGLDEYLEAGFNIGTLWEDHDNMPTSLEGGEPLTDASRETKTFLEGIPESLVREIIWPQIVVTGNTLDTFRRMTVLRLVCRSWAEWIERDFDYQDGIQAYSKVIF
jgi:hypothetical protein